MANQELSDAFDEFAANPDLWVAIITGAGDKAFSAGNDLKYHAELRAKTGARPVSPPKGFGGLTSRFDLDKPVIAAVNGVAMGGGFEIALACDIIIASDRAKFALPEPRVGLWPPVGGATFVQARVPTLDRRLEEAAPQNSSVRNRFSAYESRSSIPAGRIGAPRFRRLRHTISLR
jgi:enoyl-CoA hydratase/carnithine racemase